MNLSPPSLAAPDPRHLAELSLLAQSAQRTGEAAQRILWVVLIVLLLVVLLVVVAVVIRRVIVGRQNEPAVGFTLEDMRRLHREGRLSDEEFESARTALLARARAVAEPEEAEAAQEHPEPPTPDLPEHGPDQDRSGGADDQGPQKPGS